MRRVRLANEFWDSFPGFCKLIALILCYHDYATTPLLIMFFEIAQNFCCGLLSDSLLAGNMERKLTKLFKECL